jgi:putative heme iron utilization protein
MAEIEYRLTNSMKLDRIIIIEPWAEEFALAPGSKMTLLCTFDDAFEKIMDVQQGDNYFALWFWQSCKVNVTIDGVLQDTASSEIAAF